MNTPQQPFPSRAGSHRHYKYYDLLMAGFVTVLLCSNLIGPAKLCSLPIPFALFPKLDDQNGLVFVAAVTFGAGNIFFPISYIFGDVLTEVYGYARARKVIWAGFGALLFSVVHSEVVMRMPPDPDEPYNRALQPALVTCFGNGWRIAAGSIIAFWFGDFVNSFVLAKMKLLTRGRFLWTRTIGSTIAGQTADSLIFYPIAFYGVWTSQKMFQVVVFNWAFKVSVEIVFTPLTYLVVNFLKRAEGEDYYDRGTDFTPFSLED